jgi:hypothetical protein
VPDVWFINKGVSIIEIASGNTGYVRKVGNQFQIHKRLKIVLKEALSTGSWFALGYLYNYIPFAPYQNQMAYGSSVASLSPTSSAITLCNYMFYDNGGGNGMITMISPKSYAIGDIFYIDINQSINL